MALTNAEAKNARGGAKDYKLTDSGGLHLFVTTKGHKSCVLALDEVDKTGGSSANGDVRKGLLAMLDPGSAAVYFDSSLKARVNLSSIC